jgi:glyceraldehyde-3-phosphate dehydrogenase/erythrose-4-phosphate dehydrogenase
VQAWITGGKDTASSFRTLSLPGRDTPACDEPLVSVDFLGNPHSSILDSLNTRVMDGNFAKLLSWYDNEWGYSNRCVDLALLMGR